MAPNPEPSPAARTVRTVPATRAVAWYAEAMRIFKRYPLRFAGLAVVVVVVELALSLVPLVGAPAANVVVPIVAGSLLFAALATDRGDRPRALHLVAPFAVPARAIAAVVAATLVVSGAEWLAGWSFAGLNILSPADLGGLRPLDFVVVYGAGVIVSLPLTFVPLFAFFEGTGLRDAFAWSFGAFARNVPALLLYGGLSVALLAIVLVTQGIALVIVLPLWGASTYSAWKELYGAA